MKMYRPAEIEGDVVALHLSHGISPEDKSYIYFVLPASTRENIEKFDAEKRVKIHRNDRDAQVIESMENGGELWAIIYNPSVISIGSDTFQPPHPGIYLFQSDNNRWTLKKTTKFRL